MDTEILRKLDLTENEIKAYLALLELGPSPATRLAKHANIHRSKAYDSLQRLIAKGLVHYTVQNFRKIFVGNSVDALRRVVLEKEQKVNAQKAAVERLLPLLAQLEKTKTEESSSNVYEGLNGIKVFHNQILSKIQKEDSLAILGIPRAANELLEGFLMEFHVERVRRGVSTRLLYSYEARDKVIERKKLKHTQARYLDALFQTPATILLCDGTIGIISFHPRPVCYEIKNADLYPGFLTYFELLWSHSHE